MQVKKPAFFYCFSCFKNGNILRYLDINFEYAK